MMPNKAKPIIIGIIHRSRFIIELRFGCLVIAHEHWVAFRSPIYVKNAYKLIMHSTK